MDFLEDYKIFCGDHSSVNESTIDGVLDNDSIDRLAKQKKYFNYDSANRNTYLKLIADRINRLHDGSLKRKILETIECDPELVDGLSNPKDQIQCIKECVYDYTEHGRRSDLVYTFCHLLGINSF